ncbi:hypothetical protein F4810DRAFT_184003 [Camillea tinctor]|nr:hypothetical protein F4810DRAFT_184003 [Camillea tinctor]
MHSRIFLSSLTLATSAAALSLPIPPGSAPNTNTHRRQTDEQPPPCLLISFPQTPTNPPPCWSWFASTSTPSNYCGNSTLSPLPSTTTATTTTSSSSWVSACAALLQLPVGDATPTTSPSNSSKDFFLASYTPSAFNTLLRVPGCALHVRPARAPSDEQIYLGGADVADVLGAAVGMAGAASGGGVEGAMACGEDEVSWRVVPMD